MSLQDWERNGWLQRHKTSPNEIRDLLGVVERDLADSATDGLSADWRMNIAYNAALQAAAGLGRRWLSSLSGAAPLSRHPITAGDFGHGHADGECIRRVSEETKCCRVRSGRARFRRRCAGNAHAGPAPENRRRPMAQGTSSRAVEVMRDLLEEKINFMTFHSR